MILLALLLAFTVLHGVHDQIHEGELVVCVVFLISAVISIAVPRLYVARLVAASVSRAPPSALLEPNTAIVPLIQAAPVPLRL